MGSVHAVPLCSPAHHAESILRSITMRPHHVLEGAFEETESRLARFCCRQFHGDTEALDLYVWWHTGVGEEKFVGAVRWAASAYQELTQQYLQRCKVGPVGLVAHAEQLRREEGYLSDTPHGTTDHATVAELLPLVYTLVRQWGLRGKGVPVPEVVAELKTWADSPSGQLTRMEFLAVGSRAARMLRLWRWVDVSVQRPGAASVGEEQATVFVPEKWAGVFCGVKPPYWEEEPCGRQPL